MLQVAVVFVTDGFHEFRVRQQTQVLREGPLPGIRVGVVNRDLNVHVPEIFPVEPLDDVQRFGCRLALLIQPELSIETFRVDNERVAVPPARRIAQPCGRSVRREFPAIEKDLTPEDAESFIKDDNELGLLNELPLPRSRVDARHALGQALCGRFFARMHARRALLKQHFGPKLVWDVIDLQVRRKVRRLPIICVVGSPNSRQVGLAIRRSRWGCRKVRLAIRRPRDVGRRHFGPLCLKRYRHQDEDCNRTSDSSLQSNLPKLPLIINYSLGGLSHPTAWMVRHESKGTVEAYEPDGKIEGKMTSFACDSQGAQLRLIGRIETHESKSTHHIFLPFSNPTKSARTTPDETGHMAQKQLFLSGSAASFRGNFEGEF